MRSILLTAFEPFGTWTSNSSELCLRALLPLVPAGIRVTPRVYPVNFDLVRVQLAEDLKQNFDFAVHLGQAQQAGRIRLESIAVNVGGHPGQPAEDFLPLVATGPVAYRCELPLSEWAVRLREAGLPAYVSYHAGTYLCNATLYWSQWLADEWQLATRAAFVHLPLDVSQVVQQTTDWPTLPTASSADAIRRVMEELAVL